MDDFTLFYRRKVLFYSLLRIIPNFAIALFCTQGSSNREGNSLSSGCCPLSGLSARLLTVDSHTRYEIEYRRLGKARATNILREMMGIAIEIYAADPQEFVSLQKRLDSELTDEEEIDLLFKQLRSYPQADFSLHLHWPEDIDALCQAMIEEGLAVPPSHIQLIVEELWFDGTSACVKRLAHMLPLALAQTTKQILEQVAEQWVRSYIPDPSTNPAYFTTAFDAAVKSLIDLRQTSCAAVAQNKPLLLYLQW